MFFLSFSFIKQVEFDTVVSAATETGTALASLPQSSSSINRMNEDPVSSSATASYSAKSAAVGKKSKTVLVIAPPSTIGEETGSVSGCASADFALCCDVERKESLDLDRDSASTKALVRFRTGSSNSSSRTATTTTTTTTAAAVAVRNRPWLAGADFEACSVSIISEKSVNPSVMALAGSIK